MGKRKPSTTTEPSIMNGKTFAKVWALRLFHTIAMFFGSYFVLIGTVFNIPTIIPFVLGGLGFTVTSTMSNAEYIVAFCAGIFLTLWLVITDYMLIRTFWRIYKKNLKKTITRQETEKE